MSTNAARPSVSVILAACLLAGAALVALPAARADVIHQPGGGKIVGEIVAERADHVEIKTRGGGVMKVPREEIDRIERGPVPEVAKPPIPAPAAPTPIGPAAPPPPPGAGAKPLGPGGTPLAPPAAPGAPGGATPLQPGTGPAPRLGRPEKPGESLGTDEEALVKPRVRAVVDWFERNGGKLKAGLPQLLKQRRKEAFDFIMDPRKYPEENHGAAAQPEVDRLVGLLRRVWEDPFEEACTLSEELRRLVDELEEVADLEPTKAKVNKALAAAQEAPNERDRASLEWNQKHKSTADEEERACVDITNRYRMMFGLKVLRMDERLLIAGRKHSQDMKERGFFDHGSPVPGRETPEKRCAAEGASYSGENIAFGSGTGEGAYWQWYNSSGHHRNMLGDHATIGIGRFATHWTEDFGRDIPKQ